MMEQAYDTIVAGNVQEINFGTGPQDLPQATKGEPPTPRLRWAGLPPQPQLHVRVKGSTSLTLLITRRLRLNTILNKMAARLNILDSQGLKA
jgi:hypothetical protein